MYGPKEQSSGTLCDAATAAMPNLARRSRVQVTIRTGIRPMTRSILGGACVQEAWRLFVPGFLGVLRMVNPLRGGNKT